VAAAGSADHGRCRSTEAASGEAGTRLADLSLDEIRRDLSYPYLAIVSGLVMAATGRIHEGTRVLDDWLRRFREAARVPGEAPRARLIALRGGNILSFLHEATGDFPATALASLEAAEDAAALLRRIVNLDDREAPLRWVRTTCVERAAGEPAPQLTGQAGRPLIARLLFAFMAERARQLYFTVRARPLDRIDLGHADVADFLAAALDGSELPHCFRTMEGYAGASDAYMAEFFRSYQAHFNLTRALVYARIAAQSFDAPFPDPVSRAIRLREARRSADVAAYALGRIAPVVRAPQSGAATDRFREDPDWRVRAEEVELTRRRLRALEAAE
jgi:hypothetical protein